MIYATLVKINRDPEEAPKVEALNHSRSYGATVLDARAENTGWDFKILTKRQYENTVDAQESFRELLQKPPFQDKPLNIGVFLHKSAAMQEFQVLTLLHSNDKRRVLTSKIYNPLWYEVKKPIMRHVTASNLMSAKNNMAMQSLLFAMIDIYAADKEWMAEFSLKDEQAETLYNWEHENLNQVKNISPMNMAEMMHNILAVYTLPWIALKFIDKGDACSFAVSTDKSSALKSPSSGAAEGEWDWLHKSSERNFARARDVFTGSLSIKSMSLNFVLTWGLSYEILIHELSHYIAFVMDTPYRLNVGERPLSFNEYKDIFAGHGALYIGIFSFLLIKFLHYNEVELHQSLDNSGLSYVVVKELSPVGITRAIESYIKNSNQEHAIK